MSITSRLRNPKRPNPKRIKSKLPGPNRGLIPVRNVGLISPRSKRKGGAFGGVSCENRARRVWREMAYTYTD